MCNLKIKKEGSIPVNTTLSNSFSSKMHSPNYEIISLLGASCLNSVK